MGERKVINKYFPPDFDPTKIPRTRKADLNPNFVVRMMLPMSVRCLTCGEYMYKGKKFNSRKEDVEGPEGEYLGIKIFRFYFKCVTCSAEFTVKTDPQNMDYVVEGGAKANYVPYKDVENQKKVALKEREASEKDDNMAQLENKTKDSKVEMDILDGLDDIRSQNNRVARLEMDDVIERHRQETLRQQQLEQERRLAGVDVDVDESALAAFAEQRVKRLRDEPPPAASAPPPQPPAASQRAAPAGAAGKKPKLPPGLIVQAKSTAAGAAGSSAAAAWPAASASAASADSAPAAASATSASPAPSASSPSGGALLGLGAYGSDSGSSSPAEQEGGT